MRTDDEIITLYWERKQEAISETDVKYGNYCYSIGFRILADTEDTMECVNDTWLNAWNAIPPEKPEVLRLFLGKITRNLSLNRIRDKHRIKRGGGQAVLTFDELQECIPCYDSPEKKYEDKQVTEYINDWLSKLDKEKRVAFVRRYWFCESINKTAELLGFSESKTKSLLFRLRKELKEYLEMEGVVI